MLVGDPKGSYLRVHDNEQTTNLGKFEADGVGLFLRKDEKLFVKCRPARRATG